MMQGSTYVGSRDEMGHYSASQAWWLYGSRVVSSVDRGAVTWCDSLLEFGVSLPRPRSWRGTADSISDVSEALRTIALLHF